MAERKILPFYMTYPMAKPEMESSYWTYPEMEKDRKWIEDMEYLQQLYPIGAKHVQKEVNKALSVIDYQGSMIYDEYPDRFMLYQMAKDILHTMQSKVWDGECQSEEETRQMQQLVQKEGLEDYITVILLYEILKRRNRKNPIPIWQ